MDHETMADAYFLYRILVAVLGTATIYTAFLIGNHIKKHLGAVFALLVAMYPYYVCYAKQVTGDATVLFFLSLTMLYSLRYFDDGRYIHIILMSMGAAMATLEKWHGGIGIGYVGLVLLLSNKGVVDFIKKGFLAIASWYLWMFLFAPNIMIHPVRAIFDGFIKIAVYDGSKGAPYYAHLIDYLKFGYNYVGGILYLLMMILGIIIVFKKRSLKYAVVFCGVLKILVISVLNQDGPRWAMELYFSELLLISVAIVSLFECSVSYVRWIAFVLAGIVFLELASSSALVSAVAYYSDQDSRIIQRRACIAAGITPENAISQYYSGFGPTSWCDSEYPGTVTYIKDWNDYITEIDGELYRTSDRYEYICLDLTHNSIDISMAEKLDNRYKRLYEYHPDIWDIFNIPFVKMDVTLNDFKRITDSVTVIKDIHGGALTGDEIIVYDIANMKIIDEKNG
ncbi:MAG: glycosyltransferase family 39 protein [Lachnospiraceae bacterium]|nr:glycosyltransferase family 39 protein [Lachnospiraceae bacterium]